MGFETRKLRQSRYLAGTFEVSLWDLKPDEKNELLNSSKFEVSLWDLKLFSPLSTTFIFFLFEVSLWDLKLAYLQKKRQTPLLFEVSLWDLKLRI